MSSKQKFCCPFCGKPFNMDTEAQLHSARCRCNPAGRYCLTCKYYDREQYKCTNTANRFNEGIAVRTGHCRRWELGTVSTYISKPSCMPADSNSSKPAGIFLLRFPEAASLLGISVTTLYKWVKQGRLTPVKIGGTSRLKRSEVQHMIRASKQTLN